MYFSGPKNADEPLERLHPQRQKRQGDLSAFAIMVANTLSSFNVGRLVSYESLMSFNLL